MTNMVCPRCEHKWEYKGEAWWVTCPKCRKVIKNIGKFSTGKAKE